MKFEKFILFSIALLTFGMDGMQESDIEKPERTKQSYTNKDVPTLFDIIIMPFAKQAIEIYDKEGYVAMDRYIESIIAKIKLSKDIISHKIISYMVRDLYRADIFATKMLGLYTSCLPGNG